MAVAASFIGCAGWSPAPSVQAQFAGQGTHLQRYATRFNASEINSSFHCKPAAWVRAWGAVYLRLHGSPRMYYSSYEPQWLSALASRIALALREGRAVWCIFDNTAGSAAADNALRLQQALDKEPA